MSKNFVSIAYTEKPSWWKMNLDKLAHANNFEFLCDEHHIFARGSVQHQVTGRLVPVMKQIPSPNFLTTQPSRFLMKRNQLNCVIEKSQVALIYGEPIGKSIQIPEFLLQNSVESGVPVRILSVMHEKIAAVTAASRIAISRKEVIGDVVGYQIPLESRVSPKTVLTFCSPTVLLRTLMTNTGLDHFTHIIFNDVHKKSRLFEVIFMALKIHLKNLPELKLLLLSNWDESDWVRRYFGAVRLGVMNFEIDVLPVRIMHLDQLQTSGLTTERKAVSNEKFLKSHEPWVSIAIDTYIEEAFLRCSKGAMKDILQLLLQQNIAVDIKHSEKAITPLAAACIQGNHQAVELLLAMGARANALPDSVKARLKSGILSRLEKFGKDAPDVHFNLELVVQAVTMALKQSESGVLVLLPSYVEVEAVKTALDGCVSSDVQIFAVHCMSQFKHIKNLYVPVMNDRYIILTTDLTESLLPTSAVDVVIDCGMTVEEGNLNGSRRFKWITKAEASFRVKFAGLHLTGTCFRLYTTNDLKQFADSSLPEIQTESVDDLLLYSTLLSLPTTIPASDFLTLTPHFPKHTELIRSIARLRYLELIDLHHDPTILGYLVAETDLPVNAAKMLLFGVFLKCLDPILTIASCLCYRSEFSQLFRSPSSIARAAQLFGVPVDAASDHLLILKALQHWQYACKAGRAVDLCSQIGISEATFEAVLAKRCTVLGQLRALGLVHSRGNCDIRDLNENADNWAVVKAAVCAGHSGNFGEFVQDPLCATIRFGDSASISPNSLVYQSALLCQTRQGKSYFFYGNVQSSMFESELKLCTVVSPVTLALFSGPSILPQGLAKQVAGGRGSDGYTLTDFSLRSWLSLTLPAHSLKLLMELRNAFYAFVFRRLKTAHLKDSEADSPALKKVVEILTLEEEAIGFIQPVGIGQRPFPSAADVTIPQV